MVGERTIVVAARLRDARARRGLSQDDVADLAGLPADEIDAYEAGLEKPLVVATRYMAHLYRVPYEWLTGESDEPGNECGEGPAAIVARLVEGLDEAEHKAWNSMARYKFSQFGYWVSVWVHLNRISGLKRRNPFRKLVKVSRRNLGRE